MDLRFDQWPSWTNQAVWTAVTVGVAYLLGHVLNAVILPRLTRLARRTKGDWDDVVISEITRRVPFWSLIIGVWLSLGHWAMRDDVHTLATRFLIVLVGASVTFAAAAVASRLVVSYGSRMSPEVPVTGLTQNVARIVVTILGVLVIMNGLGVEITPLLTALGVGGLAVALALQEPLGNLFAGLFLSFAGQMRVGDYVELEGGKAGYIIDLDWRSTRIRMLSNNVIIVPNSKLAQSIVTNYHLPAQDLAVLVGVGVEYASDLNRVEQVTIEVAREVMREVPGGVPDFEPFIRYHTFGDSSIDFNVILRGREFVDQHLVRHEFIKRLHVRYAQEGIVIPFPIRTLSSRDPIPVVVRGEDAGSGPV